VTLLGAAADISDRRIELFQVALNDSEKLLAMGSEFDAARRAVKS
jgi:hypothetical protein